MQYDFSALTAELLGSESTEGTEGLQLWVHLAYYIQGLE